MKAIVSADMTKRIRESNKEQLFRNILKQMSEEAEKESEDKQY